MAELAVTALTPNSPDLKAVDRVARGTAERAGQPNRGASPARRGWSGFPGFRPG